MARESDGVAAALWRCHTIIKLDAGCGGFAVPASGMDAHLVGASTLFFMPWQSVALCCGRSGYDAGHYVVALIVLWKCL
jgi:hypothetical protein